MWRYIRDWKNHTQKRAELSHYRCLDCNREIKKQESKKRYHKNIEKSREYNRKKYHKNKEYYNEKTRQWQKENRERVNELARKYRKKEFEDYKKDVKTEEDKNLIKQSIDTEELFYKVYNKLKGGTNNNDNKD